MVELLVNGVKKDSVCAAFGNRVVVNGFA